MDFLFAPAIAEETAKPNYVTDTLLKKLLNADISFWGMVIGLAALAAILFAVCKGRKAWTARTVAYGAMAIALSFVLSYIRVFRMPQGGSITPASMLPLVLFMVACGPLQGFVVGCAYGLLLLITDPYVIHPIQLLLDYPLASGAMILGCLATLLPIERRWQLPVAVLLAGVGNYIMAVLSGAIFFAEYAGEQNAWIYSLTYNITYLGPNVLFCMLVSCIPGMTRLVDMIKKK
jgi:thiamine transporter